MVTVVVTVLDPSQSASSAAAFVAVTSTLKLSGHPEPFWRVTVNLPVVVSTALARDNHQDILSNSPRCCKVLSGRNCKVTPCQHVRSARPDLRLTLETD